jgi:hypothetical protein
VKITNFLIMDTNGVEIEADAHGNNLAFSCPASAGLKGEDIDVSLDEPR